VSSRYGPQTRSFEDACVHQVHQRVWLHIDVPLSTRVSPHRMFAASIHASRRPPDRRRMHNGSNCQIEESHVPHRHPENMHEILLPVELDPWCAIRSWVLTTRDIHQGRHTNQQRQVTPQTSRTIPGFTASAQTSFTPLAVFPAVPCPRYRHSINSLCDPDSKKIPS
jgi:hypothetical protein